MGAAALVAAGCGSGPDRVVAEYVNSYEEANYTRLCELLASKGSARAEIYRIAEGASKAPVRGGCVGFVNAAHNAYRDKLAVSRDSKVKESTTNENTAVVDRDDGTWRLIKEDGNWRVADMPY